MTARTRPAITMKRPKRWETFWRSSCLRPICFNRRFCPRFCLPWTTIPSTTTVRFACFHSFFNNLHVLLFIIKTHIPMLWRRFNYNVLAFDKCLFCVRCYQYLVRNPARFHRIFTCRLFTTRGNNTLKLVLCLFQVLMLFLFLDFTICYWKKWSIQARIITNN